ncbi:aspartic proteinase CDR1-like [Tripterygium wilfordii]|uniref:Aspartic proteinase CDR1-like n=1 Tax=Tripterygium wilfordii TaxID=458696 RepID=A0A7J7DTI0_TRIWF|nr:aspartic proteinase CDR1-like [Tripterygium wilfordii]
MNTAYLVLEVEHLPPEIFQFGNVKCDSQHRCGYGVEYMDDIKTEVTWALEQFSFQATDEGIAVVSNVLMGCRREKYQKSEGIAVVFGLGNACPKALARVSVIDHQYSYNRLALGDAGNGDPTQI